MNIWTKTTLGIITALLLGALGNGVWEYLLQPALSSMGQLALNIGTLGVKAFKDNMYREVARGFHEASSLSLSSFLYLLLGYAGIFGLFELMRRIKKSVAQAEGLKKELDGLEAITDGTQEPQQSSTNDHQGRIKASKSKLARLMPRMRRLQNASRAFFGIGLILFAWIFIGNVRDTYINNAIAHYVQSVRIATPYATDTELAIFNSRFARLASKNEYSALILDISKVAERGKLELPHFDAW